MKMKNKFYGAFLQIFCGKALYFCTNCNIAKKAVNSLDKTDKLLYNM